MTNLPATTEPLTDKQLEVVRKLAASGCKPALIRSAIGGPGGAIPPARWRRLLLPVPSSSSSEAEEDSPLAIALDVGQADLAHEVVSFMLGKMRQGSEPAAKWLGERVLQFSDKSQQNSTPRVMVVINSAMSEVEYREVTSVQVED